MDISLGPPEVEHGKEGEGEGGGGRGGRILSLLFDSIVYIYVFD